jgi:hypothetical protein
MRPTVKVRDSGLGLADLRESLDRLSRERVLVGIPEGTAPRDPVSGQPSPVNNAELMFIHSEGSALRRIPKRRVLQPAIEAPDNWARITKAMQSVAVAEMDGDHRLAVENLKKTGTIGSNAAKRWFTDPRNGWPPNAPSTIARKGSDKPLIDLGELRRAITFAVEDGNGAGSGKMQRDHSEHPEHMEWEDRGMREHNPLEEEDSLLDIVEESAELLL